MNRKERQLRSFKATATEFTTREDGDNLIIEGYFAVYNSNYEIEPGLSESIAPGAFSGFEERDVRALINHDTTLVVGRNTAGTLELRDDEQGLWGHVVINPNDVDATNVYARVKRGDVSQCSVGFDIIRESTEIREDGSIHWTIEDADLWEVSICTFPAYEETAIEARVRQADDIKKRETEAWKMGLLSRLKGESNGTTSPDEEERA